MKISSLVRSAPIAIIVCGVLAGCQSNDISGATQQSFASTSQKVSEQPSVSDTRERFKARQAKYKALREQRLEQRLAKLEERKSKVQHSNKKFEKPRVVRNEEGFVWTRYKFKVKNSGTVAKSDAKKDGSYASLIAKYAKEHGVPYKLAKAVVQVESSFRASATGAAGEVGLMQIKLATARGMGYKGSRKALYNPSTNLYWGMKYLGEAHRLSGGTTCGTILKYNAGHGAKRMNKVSSRYCGKIRRILA